MKKHPFIQDLHTLVQNYLLIGLRLIIERHIIFLQLMGSCSIMNLQEEEKLLLQEKLA